MKKMHEKALADIKTYYNDITHNNLELIQVRSDALLLSALCVVTI